MQDMLRDLVDSMMHQTAKKKNWQLYKYYEEWGAPLGMEGNTEPLPYSIRPPRIFVTSYIFIVNEDSLQAWKNWISTVQEPEANAQSSNYSQANQNLQQNNQYQAYIDSATYYSNLSIQYLSQHTSEYASAATSGNAAQLNKMQAQVNAYSRKSNDFINKANTVKNQTYSIAETQYNSKAEEWHQKKMQFRNASILRVKIDFNEVVDQPSASKTIKTIKQLPVSGSSFAILYHNNKTDEHEVFNLNQFYRAPDLAFILFGKWHVNPNDRSDYVTAFSDNSNNYNTKSEKKIMCDKIQSIAVHIEGNPDNMNQFIQSINWQQLNSLITTQ